MDNYPYKLAQLHYQIYEDFVNTDLHMDLSMEIVLDWHGKLFSLHPDRNNFAGMIRKRQVYIEGSNHEPPTPCEPILDKLWNFHNENKESLHPVLLACLKHYRFEFIHPFLDGNGRLGRLIMNYVLYNNKYPMFDISHKIRVSYYRALEKTDKTEDEAHFVNWFFNYYIRYLKTLRI